MSYSAETPKVSFPHVLAVIAVLILTSLSFNEYSVGTAISEFTSYQIKDIRAHVIFVICLQALALSGLLLLMRSKALYGLLKPSLVLITAIFLTINVFSLVFFHMESFFALSRFLTIIAYIGVFFMAFTLANALYDNKKFTLALMALSLAGFSFMFYTTTSYSKRLSNATVEAGEPAPRGTARRDARNIYLLSYDSMIPTSIVEQYLNLDEPLYIKTLKKHDAKFFKNAYSPFIPTRNSLNSILTLDPALYEETENDIRHHYFSGVQKSVVSDFLRKNGYFLQTLYGKSYLGREKGLHVDYYFNGRDYSSIGSACEHANAHVFLGYCETSLENLVPTALYYRGLPEELEKNDDFDRDLTPQLHRIKAIAGKREPWFTMVHTYMPGHTKGSFDYKDPDQVAEFRNLFESESVKTGENMDEVLTLISEVDPTAIIMVYGDHSTFIQRPSRLNRAQAIPDTQERKAAIDFFILNRFAVSLSVIGAEDCQDGFEDLSDARISTTMDVALRVIECASGEQVFAKRPSLVSDYLDQSLYDEYE